MTTQEENGMFLDPINELRTLAPPQSYHVQAHSQRRIFRQPFRQSPSQAQGNDPMPVSRKRKKPKLKLSFFCTSVLLAMTMLSLVAPLANSVDAADRVLEPIECEAGTVFSEALWKCVPLIDSDIDIIDVPQNDATEEPIEAPEEEVTPTAEPEEEDEAAEEEETPRTIDVLPESTMEAQAETSVVLINKHACPVGYDASAEDFNDLAANCNGDANGIGFGVSDGAAELQSGVTGESVPNQVTFDGLPSGSLAIYEKPGAEPVSSVVFCSTYVDEAPSNFVKMSQTAENQIFQPLNSGENLYCDWFNVPAAATGDVSIIINNHACPAGYDASAEDYYDLAANCQGVVDGIGFGVSDGASEIALQYTGDVFANGVQFENLPAGAKAIYEKPGASPVTSVIFCDGYTEGGPTNIEKMDETAENQIFYDFAPGEELYCDWFNVPATGMGTANLIINKMTCPAGYDASAEDYYDLALNCQEPVDGLEFGVSDGASEIASQATGDVMTSGINIEGLPTGPLSIYEKNATDTTSVIFCDGRVPTDNGPADFEKMTETEENQIFHIIFAENETLFCDWYNVPMMDMGTPTAEGYGDVTIYKWLCPEGFDPTELGADAEATCTEPMNGVTFTLERPGDVPLQSNTGDSIPGAVTFGGQDAGDYTITETYPDGIDQAFVWDCTGGSTPSVHPTPLNTGASFDFTLASEDALVCNWYNVPASDPDSGDLTLYKYVCSGPEYTSDVDCELYEEGVDKISWQDLNPGSYVIEEVGDEPCYITATYQDGEEHILVAEETETVVKVYNCTDPGEVPVTGKPPVEYPNTGAGPAGSSSTTTTTAQQSTPTGEPCRPVSESNRNDEEVTSVATAETIRGATCPRGEVPIAVSVESIDVEAEVEVLETVDGVMQAPTTAEVVSWYKETQRLGETGNIVMAGHLNYWGVPEGVFFELENVKVGDIITVTGDQGGVYEYEVVSVEELPIAEGPDEALAAGDVETLTMITCGGEWDADASEYQSRTVVKAERKS
jgi:sortase (surface protein transpeptidase)